MTGNVLILSVDPVTLLTDTLRFHRICQGWKKDMKNNEAFLFRAEYEVTP